MLLVKSFLATWLSRKLKVQPILIQEESVNPRRWIVIIAGHLVLLNIKSNYVCSVFHFEIQ